MARAPIAIDLGERPRDEQPEIDAPWPGWRRRLDRTRSGAGRWLPAAGAATLLLLTTTAATAPARPWAVPLFTVPAGEWIAFGPEHLYVTSQPESGLPPLTAYRLTDGELVWETRMPASDGWSTVRDGVPLYVSYDTNVMETGDDSYSWDVATTTVFDPETGEPRWTHEGDPTVRNDEVMLFQQQTERPPTRFTLEAVDVATGRSRWTFPPAQLWGYDWDQPNQARQLVSLTQDANDWRLTSYDLDTGDRLSTATLREGADDVSVVGSRVFLNSAKPPRLSAYDLATLRHQWTTDLRGEGWLVAGCRQALCVHGGVPYALDPATGEVVWSADWFPSDRLAEDDWFPEALWSQGYLSAGGWLIDTATGEPLLELAEWEPVPDAGELLGPSEGLLTRQATSGGPAGWRTWFGQLRSDPPRVEPLGSVAGRQLDCQLAIDYLVCQEGADLHVWRVPGLARADSVG